MPDKIISGGQTGVDRAALDFAIKSGIPHGGWCPLKRKAEDGPIDARYLLRETAETEYPVRTRLNIRDSDGTLVLNSGRLEGGTALTVKLAKKMGKPCLVADLENIPGENVIPDWLNTNRIRILNIAGPRESKRPGIYEKTRKILPKLLLAGVT